MRTGVVHGAAGSAYIENESTKVICAVSVDATPLFPSASLRLSPLFRPL